MTRTSSRSIAAAAALALVVAACEPDPWVCPTYSPCDCAGNPYYATAFFIPAGSLPAGDRLEATRGEEVLGEAMVAADGSAWARLETYEDVPLEGATVTLRSYALSGAVTGERSLGIPPAANAALAWPVDHPALAESWVSGLLDVRFGQRPIDGEAPPAAPLSELLVVNLSSGATTHQARADELAQAVTATVGGGVGDSVTVFFRHADGSVGGCWLPGFGLGGACRCTRAQREAGLCGPEGVAPDAGVADAGPADAGMGDGGMGDGGMGDAGPRDAEPPF